MASGKPLVEKQTVAEFVANQRITLTLQLAMLISLGTVPVS